MTLVKLGPGDDGRVNARCRGVSAPGALPGGRPQRCRVGHVVYTSISSPRPSPGLSLFVDHWRTEQFLAVSELEWTVLRNNLYADQLLDALPAALVFGRITSLAPAATTTASGTGIVKSGAPPLAIAS